MDCYDDDDNDNCEENACLNKETLEDVIGEELCCETGSTESEVNDLSIKDLPNRILAFSSKKFLKLFHKHLRTSVDGTFKFSCFLWAQQFRWSAKISGYWILIIWGGLPHKSPTSYKVRNVFFSIGLFYYS